MNNIILVFIIILTFVLLLYNLRKKEKFTISYNKDDGKHRAGGKNIGVGWGGVGGWVGGGRGPR